MKCPWLMEVSEVCSLCCTCLFWVIFLHFSMVSGQVSSIFWLLHSDLHEARVTNVLEYLSSIVASLEPFTRSMTAHRGDLENLSLLEQNLRKGRFNVRFKRRNGRVRVMVIFFSLNFFVEVFMLLLERKLI